MSEPHSFSSGLVETDWLEAHLNDPDLRILDATVFYRTHPVTGAPIIETGCVQWEQGHIPNSTFVDLVSELSDPSSKLRFAMPSPAMFARAIAQHGVGEGTRVVVYDSNNTMWATRVWWLLRAFGFEQVAVLNGGWKKWTLESRPTSTQTITRPVGRFQARLDAAWLATKAQVEREIQNGNTCVINSLARSAHKDAHIPGSINLPAVEMLDATTGAYLPIDVLREQFKDDNALDRERVVTYCGAGIAATSTAFVLSLLTQKPVAVYDGSMQEWTADSSLPVVKGEH